MKTVVGIDPSGNYDSTLRLLSRLQFTDNHLDLTNSVEMVPSYVSLSPMPVVESQGEVLHGLSEASKTLLEDAKASADRLGLISETYMGYGSPITALTDRAEEIGADLIALGPTTKSTFETFFMGSTIHGLTNHSHLPLLLSRKTVKTSGPVEALLATDHSEYFDRCLHGLLHSFPKGISKVHLLFVAKEGSLREEGGQPTEFADDAIAKNIRIIEHLKTLGVETSSMIIEGEPNHVIAETMKDLKVELLILGARGHNIVERLLGSVSAKQTSTSPNSVWVLRAH